MAKSKNRALLEKLPTIPQYFQQYVDIKINLDNTPSIPCPFHSEKTGKSFSYSKQLGIWRCFGSCHRGGDVIDMHQLNYHIKSYEEAAKSLCSLYGIQFEVAPTFERETVKADEREVYRRRLLASANAVATTPDDWIELDFIVSKYPYDTAELELFCSSRGRLISRNDGGNTS